MSITPSPDRTRFVVRCDLCTFELSLAPGDLTDGGILGKGWQARGHNAHECPACVRKAAAARRRRAKAVAA